MTKSEVLKTKKLLPKLLNIPSRSALLSMYKVFVKPHLDYVDIIYDQVCSITFHQKLEQIKYNACLTITGATRDTSKKKPYEELGFVSLQHHGWYRKLSFCLNSTEMNL